MKVDDKLLRRSLNAAIDLSVIKKEGYKDKTRNFDESIDLIINVKDVNLNDPKQRIDKELILPNNLITSDTPNVCVVASDEILLEAKNLGLDTLENDDLVKLNNEEKKSKKKFVKKYDFFIVEDKMMPNIARYLARFLGPLGKMPKPFPSGYGIVSNPEDLKVAVERYLKTIRVQLKKQPIIQVKVGKKSMDKQKVFENVKTVVNYVADQMPHKYNNLKSMYLKTTMGKPVKVDEEFLESTEV
ncbi:MAG: 50S ribosomal protein L1 [Promethearchaeota archaeon]|nr:MAG: 50S ribosomal protein L1 [Candidatus Lokiarchaeota archaeon]